MKPTALLLRSVQAVLAAATLALAVPALAQPVKVKFTLDWRYEAPATAFLVAEAKGYFKAENIDMTIDAGSGSGVAVTRVASGAYEMGFADLTSVMEFLGNNPRSPKRPTAVMMIYNQTPSAIFALRKSGIRTPADLAGKKLGAPVFDAARRAFPVFAKANGIALSSITWSAMDPTLRETMLARGDVDAISGFSFYTEPAMVEKGVKPEDLVTLSYGDHGVALYGNAVIANTDFIRAQPEAVRGVLRAIAKGYRDTIANPVEAVGYLKKREPLVNEALELRKLQLLIARTLTSDSTRKEGFGKVSPPRLSLMASQVSDVFATKERVAAEQAFDASLLPDDAALAILPARGARSAN